MATKMPSRRQAARSKTLLLPMPRDSALNLILQTRLCLERIRNGDIDRGVIVHLAQVCIVGGFIATAGHSQLAAEAFERLEQQLDQLLKNFDENGTWGDTPEFVLQGLTDVVNEYDRILGSVRLEILVRASDRITAMAARGRAPSDEGPTAKCTDLRGPSTMRGESVRPT